MTGQKHTQRLLVIRLSALGDVVHTLSAVALLKKFVPDSHITWIVEPPFVDILKNNPVVDEVIVFQKKSIAAEMKNPLWWLIPNSKLGVLVKELRSRKFTAAIDFQGLFKSGILAFLSGAPLRIGFKQSREFSDRFFTDKLDVGDYFAFDTHVVEHNVALAEFLLRIAGGTNAESGTTRIFPLPDPGEESKDRIREALGKNDAEQIGSPVVASKNQLKADVGSGSSKNPVSSAAPESGVDLEPSAPPEDGAGSKPYVTPESLEPSVTPELTEPHAAPEPRVVVLIPGTTWITKIWPQDKWVQLTTRLLEDLRNVRIVLIGGPAETEMNQYIYDRVSKNRNESNRSENTLVNLTGKTSLLDLISLFKMSDLVIGADTGPLHIAAAVDHPKVIGVYGSTPWKRNGPYGATSSVVALQLDCQPCFEKVCPLSTIACLKDLEPNMVFEHVQKVWNGLSS